MKNNQLVVKGAVNFSLLPFWLGVNLSLIHI